jgi:hypothetical protein
MLVIISRGGILPPADVTRKEMYAHGQQ